MVFELSVDVQVASVSANVPPEQDIEAWIGAVLLQLDFNDTVEVSVRVVDNEESRALNRDFRDQDKSTNVLSFPADGGNYIPENIPRPLGDIVICAPVVEREAEEQGKDVNDHWTHLVVHGTLHLLGFDHECDPQAAEMEAIEREILAARGIADPYAEPPVS